MQFSILILALLCQTTLILISGTIELSLYFDLLSDPIWSWETQFTLTCISTGGPATTVTWTGKNVTNTEETETVLDDPVTAQYTHTLNVTGRMTGLYTCTVSNIASHENISLDVQGDVHSLYLKSETDNFYFILTSL